MSVIEPPLEWLVAALESRDPEVRFTAITGLQRRGDRAAAEVLISVLRGRRPAARRHAAQALRSLGESAVAPLVEVLGYPDPNIRFIAAYILGSIGDPRALERLRRMQEKEEGQTSHGRSVRDMAVWAILSIEKAQRPSVDPWELVLAGHYDEALEAYTQLCAEDGEVSHLMNRGSVHLLRDEYELALQDFEDFTAARDPRSRADGEYMMQGVCHWYLDHPDQAVPSWRQSLTAPYTDAAGGALAPALLLYAAERLGDSHLRKETLTLLRKRARRKLGAWPGAIVPYLLGRIGTGQLEQEVWTTQSEILRTRFQCQADFYVALRALREGYSGVFRERMTRCAESERGQVHHEFYLARWEVRRQFPEPAFPSGANPRAHALPEREGVELPGAGDRGI